MLIGHIPLTITTTPVSNESNVERQTSFEPVAAVQPTLAFQLEMIAKPKRIKPL